jgi:hypothetical protein
MTSSGSTPRDYHGAIFGGAIVEMRDALPMSQDHIVVDKPRSESGISVTPSNIAVSEESTYISMLVSAYSGYRSGLYTFREVPDHSTGGENVVRWATGDTPNDNHIDMWKMLSDQNLTTIINFSDVHLEMTSGFEIINFSPNITSLCAPMTDSEERLVQDFLSIIKTAISTKRLYVCGNQLDRLSLCAILLSRVGTPGDGVGIKGTSVTEVHKLLVEKFS